MAGGGEAAARDSLATDDGQESGSDAPAPAAAKVGVSPRCACNSHASDCAQLIPPVPSLFTRFRPYLPGANQRINWQDKAHWLRGRADGSLSPFNRIEGLK